MTEEEKQAGFEYLGQAIDELDNLAHALNFPLPPQMHVEALRSALPELVKKMKQHYVTVSGEDPWEE